MMNVKFRIEREKDSFFLHLVLTVMKQKEKKYDGIYLSKHELYGLNYDSHRFLSHKKILKWLN